MIIVVEMIGIIIIVEQIYIMRMVVETRVYAGTMLLQLPLIRQIEAKIQNNIEIPGTGEAVEICLHNTRHQQPHQ